MLDKSTIANIYKRSTDAGTRTIRKLIRRQNGELGGKLAEGVARGEIPREKAKATMRLFHIRAGTHEKEDKSG